MAAPALHRFNLPSHLDNDFSNQGLRSPDQIASRAALLAGLRTGGPRSASPANGTEQDFFASQQAQQLQQSPKGQLKANAAVFTPGGTRVSPPPQSNDQMTGLEDQLVAMRMQALASQNQANVAAIYGAAQGQPQAGAYSTQQDNSFLLQRQQQAQQAQQQLLQSQLAAQQQMQIELLRFQALQQQQQQQQQVAAQQRLFLAQIHAEYERQAQAAAYGQQQQQQQQQQQNNSFGYGNASSAQEQRQAAQASIQASLRNRQAQQLYAQMQDQSSFYNDDMPTPQAQAAVPLEQRSWRSGSGQVDADTSFSSAHHRNATPPSLRAATNQARKPSASATTASWRARSMTPSIVIDDGASDNSRASSVDTPSYGSDGEATPETSEEDLDVSSPLRKAALGATGASARYAGVGKGLPSMHAALKAPRALSLASAPRTRAFSAEAKEPNAPMTTQQLPVAPRRQPRGPPTDFQAHNFVARNAARTRREAMTKLCASPRAAAFSRIVSSPIA